jgi:hypothetical protein
MIFTAHIGQIDPERQACIDRQREVYGDGLSVITNAIGYDAQADMRSEMDRYRLFLIRDGGGWLDSDVWPNEAWQPTEDGIWLCHSYGRLDYWAIFNVNRNEYIAEMLAYCDAQKPAFGWPLAWFNQHRADVKLIPSEVYEHKYLTTSKAKE